MKNIIVPTDFSDTAKNAFDYARELSKKLNGKVNVIHFCHPDLNVVSEVAAYPTMEEVQVAKKKQLEAFVLPENEADIGKGQLIETEVKTNFAVTGLEELSKKENVDLIVMGTKGGSGLVGKMLGSTASNVSQQAHCPVWIVPHGVKFDGIKNVLYASDFEHADDKVLEQVVHLARTLKANTHLVHVSKDGQSKSTDSIKFAFEQLNAPVKFSLSTIHGDNIWDSLDNYAEKHQMDLMVLVTRHRSFWERMRHRSISKEISIRAKVPIMIMHMDDRNEKW